jgi:hypothetical protein
MASQTVTGPDVYIRTAANPTAAVSSLTLALYDKNGQPLPRLSDGLRRPKGISFRHRNLPSPGRPSKSVIRGNLSSPCTVGNLRKVARYLAGIIGQVSVPVIQALVEQRVGLK